MRSSFLLELIGVVWLELVRKRKFLFSLASSHEFLHPRQQLVSVVDDASYRR